MSDFDFQGKWYVTKKTLKKMGLDVSQIQTIAKLGMETQFGDELALIKQSLSCHLLIDGDKFKLYFPHEEKLGKLSCIRKGTVVVDTDKKGRPCMLFVDKEGEEGVFTLKGDRLVDSTSPFRFSRDRIKL